MPVQRRDALSRGHVPHFDHFVLRPGDDAPAVGEDGDAAHLNQEEITTLHAGNRNKKTPHHTKRECPASVATHSPVATSHTLTVLSLAPETTRRPSGKTATLIT